MLLKTNIKGEKSFEIGKYTIVSGPNLSGKTGVLQALQFAFTGKVSGAKSDKDLLRLVPAGVGQVYSTLTGEAWSANANTFLKPTGAIGVDHKVDGFGAATVPVTDMSELLGIGSDKLREQIIERFGVDTSIRVPALVTGEMLTLWNEVTKGLTKLSEAQNACDKKKRECNAASRDAAAELAKITKELNKNAPPVELLPELKKQLSRAQAFERQQHVHARKQQLERDIQLVEGLIVTAIEGQAQAAVKLAEAEAAQRIVEQKPAPGAAEITWQNKVIADLNVMLTAAKLAQERASECCPLCLSNEVSTLASTTAAMRQMLDQAAAEVTRLRQAQTAFLIESQQAQTAVNNARATVQRWASDLTRHQRTLLDYRQTLAGLVEALEPYEGPSATAIQADIALIEKNARLREAHEQQTARKFNNDRLSTTYKALEGQAKTVEADAVKATQQLCEDTVNKYLFAGQKARLVAEDGGKVSWEMRGGDGEWRGKWLMTGAQKVGLAVALALAWTEGKKFRAVLIDAVDDLPGLDDDNFTRLCNTLAASPIDFAAITRVGGPQVSGWTTVALTPVAAPITP